MIYAITIRSEQFILHHSGCLYWENRKMLLIADVHLGKVSHFRKAGLAVPQNSVLRNFENLDAVIAFFNPETICFLGDLFHSKLNNEWKLFETWVRSNHVRIVLVAGNHDIISPVKYDDIGVEVFSELVIGKFLLAHHPTVRADFFTFCGHIHPCIRLRGKGRQFLKLSCFFQTESQMILPAFGEFTGTYEMIPADGDCVYAVTKDEVIKVCGD